MDEERRPSLSSWIFGRRPDRLDVSLTLGIGLAAGAAVWLAGGSPWLALLSADVGAGVVANATRSTAAWYAARPTWVHVVFVLLHAGHVGLAALFGGGSIAWATAVFVAAAAGVLLVRVVPRGSASSVALGLVVVGALVLPPLPAVPAFAPLFLLKLVYGFGAHARRSA